MKEFKKDLVVIGGGPGGYTAAFRAADLNRNVTLIEKHSSLGGVCLNVGCIPSKTLLHLAHLIEETESASYAGVVFRKPEIDLNEIRSHKESVVNRLTGGLDQLCRARNIERITGEATFESNTAIKVTSEDGEEMMVTFNDLIIAVGSSPVRIAGIPYEDERVWDSTKALELTKIPESMTIIGGGIIGLEMASIYHALGTKITIVEMADSLILPADDDLKRPLIRKISKQYEKIHLKTKVTKVEPSQDKLVVSVENSEGSMKISSEVVLVVVGRKPNSDLIGIGSTSIATDDKMAIITDDRQRTNVDHVFAIGDVTGNPMLAHRSAHQGKVAAEVACNLPSAFTVMGIPSVTYTSPEIAWVGLTEKELKEQNIAYIKGTFPWQANGRALSSLAAEGISKALFDKESKRLLGAGITGVNAGELISEAVIALEMGAVAEDIALSVHPHPTLSETFAVSAEAAVKSATDTLNK
ncbi:MAG: dihydrolipoyl dehydrogenase [Sphaerochaetaceae bacterium]